MGGKTWPATVAACHTLLQYLHNQVTFMTSALSAAVAAVKTLEETQTKQQREAQEIDRFLQQQRQLSIEDIAENLMKPGSLELEYRTLKASLPLLHHRLEGQLSTSYDDNVKSQPAAKQQKWKHRKQTKLHKLMCDQLRSRNRQIYFCLTLARSLCLEHQHIPAPAYASLCFEQVAISKATLSQACASLKDWIPPVGFECTDELILASIDNLDMYARKPYSRLKGGELVQSRMIHAVVTERILFDKSILHGPAPTGDLLIRDTASIVKHSALPLKPAVHEFLGRKWKKYMEMVETTIDPMELFARPPPACDHQNTGHTICVSLPILTNRSTASKVDVTAAIKSVKDRYPGKKLMLVMDYQTFAVSWWIKMRQQDLFKDVILVGDELHRQFHTDDCIYRLWWKYVLEPAAMWLHRKDIKQSFSADKFNNKEVFVRLVTIAGLTWLSKIAAIDESMPRDPVELMEAVRENLPVWEFISFLFYGGVFALSDKEAMRTAHASELDFAWSYTSILARSGGKTNYAKYGVLMNLVLHSTHQWIRNVLDNHRTYRETDRPCTGMGLGTSIEHSVRAHKAATAMPSDHRLSAANVAMTAKRESRKNYENYLGLKQPARSKAIVLSEDILALVEQFDLSFGSSYSELQEAVHWSNFANRGIEKSDCGASLLGSVWGGIPSWVESLTTTSDGSAPEIFEPPDVDDPNYIDLDLDGSGGDDDDDDGDSFVRAGAGLEGGASSDGGGDATSDATGGSQAGSWAKRAAAAWMKTHSCHSSDPAVIKQRHQEVESLFDRASRRRALFEKRARETIAQERAEEEAAIEAVEQFEAQQEASKDVQWEVEEIRGKQLIDGVVHYRVKWLNYGYKHNTWEQASNLEGSEMLITKFEEQIKTKKKPIVSIHQYTQTGRKRRRGNKK